MADVGTFEWTARKPEPMRPCSGIRRERVEHSVSYLAIWWGPDQAVLCPAETTPEPHGRGEFLQPQCVVGWWDNSSLAEFADTAAQPRRGCGAAQGEAAVESLLNAWIKPIWPAGPTLPIRI